MMVCLRVDLSAYTDVFYDTILGYVYFGIHKVYLQLLLVVPCLMMHICMLTSLLVAVALTTPKLKQL
jgi:hypothetical protein